MSKTSSADNRMAKEMFNNKCAFMHIDGYVHSVATVYSDDFNPFNIETETTRFNRFKRWWLSFYENHLYMESMLDDMGGRPRIPTIPTMED